MKAIAFTSLAILVVSVAIAARPGLPKAVVGEVTPSWSESDYTGKTLAVDQFRGKFVVLEWTNPDCPFVQKHYGSGNMQATQEKARAMGAVWLTVMSSAPNHEGYRTGAQIAEYRKQMKVNSTSTLLDGGGKLGHIYEAKTTPQIVIINPKGVVIYNGAIDNRPTAEASDIPGAKNYALAALKEAAEGHAVAVPTTRPYGCSVKY